MSDKSRKKNLFNTIFFYFIVSVLGSFIFLLLTNTYYISILQKTKKNQYIIKLENLTNSIQSIFDEMHSIISVFTLNESLKDIVTNNRDYKNSDFLKVHNATNVIQNYPKSKDYIHSLFILSEEDDLVISNYGTSRIDEFFRNLVNYNGLNKYYWNKFYYEGNNYEVLPPSFINSNSENRETKVIPVVQLSANGIVFADPLIMNIRESYIVELLNDTKLSKNSLVFQYKENYIISRSNSNKPFNLRDTELIQLARSVLEDSNSNQQYFKKFLVVSKENKLSGTGVCAITPYSDLFYESLAVLRMPAIIFAIGVLLVTFISFMFSRRIYTPIHSIAMHLRENYQSEKDLTGKNDLEFLNQNIQLIISDMIKLKADLSLAIPYVCEHYLLSLFSDNEILREDEVTNFLSQHEFSFPHNNFLVIYSVLNFKEDFFKTHSKTEYNAICQGSILIGNDTFVSYENRYIFTVATNVVCIVLNLKDIIPLNDISECLEKYHQSLEIEDSMMVIHSGVGRLNQGLNGLKLSYKEALQASSQITFNDESIIRFSSELIGINSSPHYTIAEENHLINYLLQGNSPKVLESFNKIIDNNTKYNLSENSLKELYLQFYNTAIRVINRKNLNIYDVMGEEYINISSHIGDLKCDEINKYIKNLFVKITTINDSAKSLKELTNIKQYLDTYYMEEIYLDLIADHFGKSPNYMSKYIKNTLGVSYQDYISELRINKAKELLQYTDKSISEISKEIGFNTRHPFIRKFKILEGISPTDYRQINRLG